jgi:hypothetical protein
MAAHEKTPRCKILNSLRRPDSRVAFNPVFPGEITMIINDKAPDFTLQDENGKDVALKDLRGKVVVLFFYPRANTPG